MTLRPLLLAVCLATLGALALVRESVAAPKVDLEDYIGTPPLLNDSKTFLATADEYTETAVSVQVTAKRITVVLEQTEPNSSSTSQQTQAIEPGKRLLQGTLVLNDGTDELTFLTPKPKKLVPFQLVPNKPYKFKIPSKVLMNGVKVAKGVEYGTFTFLGFEDVVTPLGTFPNCAHFKVTDNLRAKSGRGWFEVRDQIEAWEAVGIGHVRFIQSENVFDNGQLTDSTPPTEYLFDHGVVGGDPIGPPEATSAGASAAASAPAVSSASGAGIDLIDADASLVTQDPGGVD